MICNYRIELPVVKECITVRPGLVIECAALDSMPSSRDEAAWRIMYRVLANVL